MTMCHGSAPLTMTRENLYCVIPSGAEGLFFALFILIIRFFIKHFFSDNRTNGTADDQTYDHFFCDLFCLVLFLTKGPHTGLKGGGSMLRVNKSFVQKNLISPN